jgi:hypothetical protein
MAALPTSDSHLRAEGGILAPVETLAQIFLHGAVSIWKGLLGLHGRHGMPEMP